MSKKIAALLNYGINGYDVEFEKNILYFNSVTKNLPVFPIYNTNGNIPYTEELLNQLYNSGFRIFIGFSSSSSLSALLPWFNSHEGAVGLSFSSSADSLDIPKPVYRFQPTDNYVLKSLEDIFNQTIETGGRIFYIYTGNQLASQNVLETLETNYPGKIVTYELTPDYTNLTEADIKNFYNSNSISSIDMCLIYIFSSEKRQEYTSYFNSSYNINASQYDILQSGFPLIDINNTSLVNQYNVIQSKNISTSTLYNQAQEYLGKDFVPQTISVMYFAGMLEKKVNINYLYSYASVLEFNENNDIKYSSINFYQYKSNGLFESQNLYSEDPLYGDLFFEKIN